MSFPFTRRSFVALLPAGALAAESRRMTADEALEDLLAGNERFVAGSLVEYSPASCRPF